MVEGRKLWFKDVGGVESIEDVWRVEFQLRRKVLKSRQINSLEDLEANQHGLWKSSAKQLA